MLSQTINQILPLLELLQEPAFCLQENGEVFPNRAAKHLAPVRGAQFLSWLGDSADAYLNRTPDSHLELPVCAAGQPYYVTIHTLHDGLFCLMRSDAPANTERHAMAVASQVLRQPLSDLSCQIQQLSSLTADPSVLQKAASMQRQLYRISRISSNLTDLELLHRGKYPLRMQRLDVSILLTELLEEVSALAAESGHSLRWTVPENSIALQGDEALLKRAVLNLLSNAMKYSPAGSGISVHVRATAEWVLIQVDNPCEEDSSAVLRGAFDRLNQRDLLPDPRWGIGLGLPLMQAIAQAHGGITAMEYRNGMVTVTLSLSRRRSTEPVALHAPPFLYDGGLRQTLLELSDCLPNTAFHPDAL